MISIKKITALLLAGCCCVLSCVRAEQSAVRVTAMDAQALEFAEAAINATNDIRVAYGLSELATTPLLLDLTEVRANELTIVNDHVRPDGTACFTVLKSAGITYFNAAENIAAGRPDSVATVEQWMASPNHRKNILNETHTHVAVARAYDPDSQYGYYWCMFLLSVYDGSQPHIYDDQYIPSRDLGDVNGSRTINAADAAMILQYSAVTASGMEYPVVHDFEKAADVNGDGRVDSIDASIILTYTVNKSAGNGGELKDYIW